ncbi:MAG: deoxyribodipyrimidine photo-lyase, partial [Lewinella sp.]|nr:deoxyribodipyrimidine photo-lyase [Lewinella sp.]
MFEADEVTKADGSPYTVFTPYARRWRAKLAERTEHFSDKEGRQQTVSY